MTLALATTNPTPITLGWRGALLALDLAHQLADRAHRAMIEAPLGSMLPAVDAWHAAEREVERCVIRERAERRRAQGLPWLKEVRT